MTEQMSLNKLETKVRYTFTFDFAPKVFKDGTFLRLERGYIFIQWDDSDDESILDAKEVYAIKQLGPLSEKVSSVITKGSFPDISAYLTDSSNCVQAGGRNVAQVFLDIYNAIPKELTMIRTDFSYEVDKWLKNDVSFVAPEMFPMAVWQGAGRLLSRLFTPYKNSEWVKQCKVIYSGES